MRRSQRCLEGHFRYSKLALSLLRDHGMIPKEQLSNTERTLEEIQGLGSKLPKVEFLFRAVELSRSSLRGGTGKLLEPVHTTSANP